jgi:hypothetical protein
MNIVRFARWSLFALAALATAGAAAQATYSYLGQPFVTVFPPYSVTDRVIGSFETAAPLEPWLIDVDISARVTGFSYTDGQQTRTAADSAVCGFRVTTDATGAIVAWVVNLRELPLPAPGAPQLFLDSNRAVDQGGTGPAGATPCAGLVPTVVGNVLDDPGDWTGGGNVPATPADYVYDGAPFAVANPPLTTADSVNVAFRLAGPLPPLLDDIDLVPFIETLQVDDGNTMTSGVRACSFRVTTDVRGAPVEWSALIGFDPPPVILVPFPHWRISSDGDQVGRAMNACPGSTPVIDASNAVPGAWTSDAIAPLQPTTYLYQGAPYTTFIGNVPNQGRLTGQFTLDAPLPPNLPLTDLGAALTDLRFSDPIQVRTAADTAVCDFRVATDSRGAIVDWVLLLREVPAPPAMDPIFSIDSTPSLTQSAIGVSTGADCDPIGLTDLASTSAAGAWFGGPVRPVPALGALGLAILALVLAGAGLRSRFSPSAARRAVVTGNRTGRRARRS